MFGLLRRGTEKRSCGVKKLRRITTSQRNLMEVHEPRFSWCKNREPQLVASTTPRGSEREALKRRPGKKKLRRKQIKYGNICAMRCSKRKGTT